MNSDSQVGTLNFSHFLNQLTGGATNNDGLSSTSSFQASPAKKSDNTLKYILIAVALYAAFVYFNRPRVSRSRSRKSRSVEGMSQSQSQSTSQSQSQSEQSQQENMSNLSQVQSQTQSTPQSQSEQFLFEFDSSDSHFRALKREFAPEVHLSRSHMEKVIRRLRKMQLNKPAETFLKQLRRHLKENSADLDKTVFRMYALLAIIIQKVMKCDDINKLEKMSKQIDEVPKRKLERLNIKKALLLEIISSRVTSLKNRRQYHNLMKKVTTHAKFLGASHDLNVLVDFLRDNASDVNALKKMTKYIKDLKPSEFEKKFVENVAISRDDIRYVINSRISGKDDTKSDKLMKKLKALVYVHNGDNIKQVRQLFRDIKDRDVKISTLSAKLKEINDMPLAKFNDRLTDAINFSQTGIVKAIEQKIAKIERLRLSKSH